eukprot:TRINITY_DN10330_c0_g2_i1.p1 TRINITY_DN10330_c0_g2~~TRINITY_DN10330_c0_g2_i1.p1  ORF type:complete len:294 (-),score=49.24 TRINITY_DN10330_c0_g2_i1:64-945(-)
MSFFSGDGALRRRLCLGRRSALILLLFAGAFVRETTARYRSKRRSSPSRRGRSTLSSDDMGSAAAIVAGAAVLAVAVLCCLFYVMFLESSPEPRRLRQLMGAALLTTTVLELYFVPNRDGDGDDGASSDTWWLVSTILFSNVWGGLDAVLRFPAASTGLSTPFAAKQLVLVFLKLFICWRSLAADAASKVVFGCQVFIYVGLLPVGFAISFAENESFHEERRRLATVGDDQDLLLRLGRPLWSAEARRNCALQWRRSFAKAASALAERSEMARKVADALCPSHRKILSKGRSV